MSCKNVSHVCSMGKHQCPSSLTLLPIVTKVSAAAFFNPPLKQYLDVTLRFVSLDGPLFIFRASDSYTTLAEAF